MLDPDQLKALYQKLGVNSDSEALLIYLRETLSLESEISIFEIEETELTTSISDGSRMRHSFGRRMLTPVRLPKL